MPARKQKLTKVDLKKIADKILDREMYRQRGYHQYLKGSELTAYKLVYGNNIDFITNDGFFGIGRKTIKKTLLSRSIGNNVYDVWVYFLPHRNPKKSNTMEMNKK